MKCSVVIRNRNEERYIGHCIQSVVDFLGDDTQIIVVDNESSDESLRIVNTFDYLNIEVVTIDKNSYSPGRSLNLGISKCKERLTMIISAHCEIIKFGDYERNILSDTSDNVAMWGKQIPIWDGKKVTPRYLWSNFGDEEMINHFCESEDRYFFHNAFSIFKTKHLKKYPFDERLSGKEDRYWATEQIGNGHNITYNPQFIVKHHYTNNGATWKGVG